MPTYEYLCEKCGYATEIFHAMSDSSDRLCDECEAIMIRQIGTGYAIIKDNPSGQELKKRQEKAKERRSQLTSRTHEGIGSGQGRALGGQHFEVDKKEFIQAAAKDPGMVKIAQDALKGKGKYKKKKD